LLVLSISQKFQRSISERGDKNLTASLRIAAAKVADRNESAKYFADYFSENFKSS
jgi:ribosomal protein L31E